MCRCCQNCWEDFYWNCFEEKFCYDESIANYNPEDDEEYMAATQKNGSALGHIQTTTDNNNLTVPMPVCIQPMRRGNSAFMSAAKIHEEDYRRETQTNVPMLGPEILAVFANSQIFQDHQPTKMNRISTKPYLAGIHTPNHRGEFSTTPRESEQERLLRRLEGNLNVETSDQKDSTDPTAPTTPTAPQQTTLDTSPDKRITFTISTDSSPEGSQILTPKKFDVIAEEDSNEPNVPDGNGISESDSHTEVILRPRLIDRHLAHHQHSHHFGSTLAPPKRTLRSVKSVPHFNVRPAASETDIFSITGSGNQISMTPEVPSISYSNLPKNYEDTPTIEKYRVSQSLYSIQTANAARATQDDYSMPRYFRRSALLTQSNENIFNAGPSTSTASIASITKGDMAAPRRQEKEKSKRLQMLRGNLPPLLIHSVSFRKNRDEGKQVD